MNFKWDIESSPAIESFFKGKLQHSFLFSERLMNFILYVIDEFFYVSIRHFQENGPLVFVLLSAGNLLMIVAKLESQFGVFF